MQGENTKLKQFLLGGATEKDAEEIGVRIISEPEFDEKMAFAEGELIEDFLDHHLSGEEMGLFYQNYLTTPERIERLRETALLRNYAKDHLKPAVGAAQEKKSGGLVEGLRAFFMTNLRPIAAILIVAVIGAIVWRVVFYEAGGLSQIEKDYAALNAKDLGNSAETNGLTNKNLLAGTFRDTDSNAKLKSETLTENILFRLALPAETPKDATFDLELARGDQTVFRQPDLRVYQNQSGQELKVILPKSVLIKGNYRIKLSSGASYGFAVE
jgi:hypothetical protein